jgi:site-specific DNA-methyltransferase (adenine-specific)
MLLTYNGDCIETMRQLPENSVDSIVTDPPYELGFMGKSWDASGIAFNVEVWQEALRVLKPGGHLLAFSGSRTYHRMAVAIEDAGFEIRDQIMWVYGSGFPKSLDVAKAIDKSSGFEGQVIGKGTSWNRPDSEEGDVVRMNVSPGEYDIKELSPTAKQWQGWGTALKPAHEPIVVARKPLIGTVAENVLTFGTGGLNIDGGRIPFEEDDKPQAGHRTATFGTQETQSGGDGSGGWSASTGRWPANFIHDGSDEVLELFPSNVKGGTWNRTQGARHFNNDGEETNYVSSGLDSSVGSAARFFYCAKANKRDRNEGLDGFEVRRSSGYGYDRGLGNAGEGMFKDRNPIKANHHPTVKPTSLMQYLVRLVTPPNGIVLDPFMGSGSTGKACVYEGFSFIGIDQSAEYVEIANARIQFAKDHLGESE